MAYRHDGFYASMDTFKDKQQLDDMYAHGDAPWEVWKNTRPREEAAVSILDAPADAT
jgi:glucose-1-phosphate cytidylyltransferase